MMTMTMGRQTPRPLTRAVRGMPGWTLDILSGSLSSGMAFSRASGGGHFGPAGLWAAAGTDAPRIDHHPATLAPRGLLIEAQRTNLLLWNRDLTNAAWVKTNMTAAKSATGIDGVTNSATRLTATGNNGTVLQAVTSASAARATSAYVRRINGMGTVEMTQDGGTNWTAVTLTGSWTRVGPASATVTNPSVGFRLGTSGDAIEVDYVQLENGAFASSAIATTTASATRAAETASIPSLAGIGFNPAEGTLLVEYSAYAKLNTGSYNKRFAAFTDGTLNNRFGIGTEATEANIQAAMVTGGATHANMIGTAFDVDAVYKSALAYRTDDVVVCNNGGTVSVDTSATVPTVDRLDIGHIGGAGQPFGHIRKVVYYPARLPNGQLQALTQ